MNHRNNTRGWFLQGCQEQRKHKRLTKKASIMDWSDLSPIAAMKGMSCLFRPMETEPVSRDVLSSGFISGDPPASEPMFDMVHDEAMPRSDRGPGASPASFRGNSSD